MKNLKLTKYKFLEYFLCTFITTVLFLGSTVNTANGQTLANDPLYQLVFFDEFDSLALNTNKWDTKWPWGPNIPNSNFDSNACAGSMDIAYNYYPPFHSIDINRTYDTTGSGFHRMISKRENTPVTGQVYTYDVNGNYTGTIGKPFKYTTAMLWSKKIFKFGYIELKYRLSNVSSLPPNNIYNAYGPNLWMWRGLKDTAFASYSEIDIFEQRGIDWNMGACVHYRRYPNKDNSGNLIAPPTGNPMDTLYFHANCCPSAYPPQFPYSRKYFGPFNGGAWHIVGCEWTPEYLDFYYDSQDTLQRFTDNKIKVSKLNPMPLIIDNYTPAFQYCIPFDTLLTTVPFNYDVDYIKVYQIKQDCSTKIFNGVSSSNYPSVLYKDVTLNGTSVFNNGFHHICGQDFVTLNDGFEISGTNSTIIIDSKKCQLDQTIQNGSALPYDYELLKQISSAKKHE